MKAVLFGFIFALHVGGICDAAEVSAKPSFPKGVKHLRSPKDLVASEYIVTVDGSYDGQKCTPGLAYYAKDSSGEFRAFVFATTKDFLKKNGDLADLEKLLGKGKGHPDLRLLFCGDAHYSHLADLGPLTHNSFDRAFLSVGDTAQDLCGDATMTVLANKGNDYYGVSLDLEGLGVGYTCDKKKKETDEDCIKRNQCLKQFLADEAKVSAIKAKVLEFLTSLKFH